MTNAVGIGSKRKKKEIEEREHVMLFRTKVYGMLWLKKTPISYCVLDIHWASLENEKHKSLWILVNIYSGLVSPSLKWIQIGKLQH